MTEEYAEALRIKKLQSRGVCYCEGQGPGMKMWDRELWVSLRVRTLLTPKLIYRGKPTQRLADLSMGGK